ncbi:DRAP deaminase [Coemansia sp. RSA 2704]|nr:DRAP deaminase [Coemansia sp. RSA 2705]KAJ2321468.1 DRAP deaminase [Coemansia sp. RSA 2704]
MGRGKKHKLSESFVGGNVVNPRGSKNAKTQEPAALQAADVYFEEGGLQRVHPYYHRFATHAKGRWVGRTIFDVFTQEFRDRPKEYYAKSIEKGVIEINNQTVAKDTVVRNGDLVTHFIHRHEPPITTEDIGIVRETEDGLLAINKPGSIPVHPTGRYNYNTVTKLLEVKHGYRALFPINRLDRLTSGLMLVGLNPTVARRLERELIEHRIQKEYVCKVQGEFPAGKVVCNQPIRVVAHKLALNCVDFSEGKPSLTEFERLYSEDGFSIVYCRPKTGRTHQIRVHLQFLGFPIANDPLYNNVEVWGDAKGKAGALPQALAESAEPAELVEPAEPADGGEPIVRPAKMVGACDGDRKNDSWKTLIRRMEDWKDRQDAIEHVNACVGDSGPGVCEKCSNPVLLDPLPHELCIWLHAWRYSGPDWSFETELPEWARKAAGLINRVKYNPEPAV